MCTFEIEMYHKVFIFFICCGLLGMAGCGNRVHHRIIRHQLDSAEALIHRRPDSALRIVYSADTTLLSMRKDRARYALLRTMAEDKNYIDKSDDSLIRIAQEYYEKHGTDQDKMLSWYYLGIIQKNGANYTDAILSFEKAENFAQKIKNYRYLGLIDRNRAEAFSATNDLTGAYMYHQKALEAFLANNDTIYAEGIRYSLGVDLVNMHKYDEARAILIPLRDSCGTPSLVADCDIFLAQTYVAKGDSMELAVSLFRDNLSKIRWSLHYAFYACALAQTGQKDSADYWFAKAHQKATRREENVSIDYLRAYIDHLEGDYEPAYFRVQKAAKVQDSLTRVLLQQSLTKAQKNYFEQEALLQESVAKRQRILSLSAVIITLLTLLTAVLLFYYYRKKQEATLKEQMAQLSLYQKSMQKESASLVGKLFFERLSNLLDLSNAYFSTSDAAKQADYYRQFRDSLKGMEHSKELYTSLSDDLDLYCDGIMSRLKEQVPGITEKHLRFAAMSFAGIPDRFIQILTGNNSIQSVRTFRTRLRTEIKGASAPDEILFLEMLRG